MKDPIHHAVCNAANIGWTVAALQKGRGWNIALCDRIAQGAQALAAIEVEDSFEWENITHTDWDECCSEIAERIINDEMDYTATVWPTFIKARLLL